MRGAHERDEERLLAVARKADAAQREAAPTDYVRTMQMFRAVFDPSQVLALLEQAASLRALNGAYARLAMTPANHPKPSNSGSAR